MTIDMNKNKTSELISIRNILFKNCNKSDFVCVDVCIKLAGDGAYMVPANEHLLRQIIIQTW